MERKGMGSKSIELNEMEWNGMGWVMPSKRDKK